MNPPTIAGFRIEGNSLHLARYMAEANITDLLSWSCLRDEIEVELERISIRVSQSAVEESGRIHFHATHHGPGKRRAWSRTVEPGARAKHIAALIIADIETIRSEFRLLEI